MPRSVKNDVSNRYTTTTVSVDDPIPSDLAEHDDFSIGSRMGKAGRTLKEERSVTFHPPLNRRAWKWLKNASSWISDQFHKVFNFLRGKPTKKSDIEIESSPIIVHAIPPGQHSVPLPHEDELNSEREPPVNPPDKHQSDKIANAVTRAVNVYTDSVIEKLARTDAQDEGSSYSSDESLFNIYTVPHGVKEEAVVAIDTDNPPITDTETAIEEDSSSSSSSSSSSLEAVLLEPSTPLTDDEVFALIVEEQIASKRSEFTKQMSTRDIDIEKRKIIPKEELEVEDKKICDLLPDSVFKERAVNYLNKGNFTHFDMYIRTQLRNNPQLEEFFKRHDEDIKHKLFEEKIGPLKEKFISMDDSEKAKLIEFYRTTHSV